MKKNLLILALIFFSFANSEAFCEINVQNFIQKFSTCTQFLVNSDNKVYVMLGWSQRRCFYKEISTKEEVTCGFKTLELQEVSNAMKREGFNPNTKGLTSLKIMKKYGPMQEVCTIVEKQATPRARRRR